MKIADKKDFFVGLQETPMSDRTRTRPAAIPTFRISCLLLTLAVIGLTIHTLHNRSLTVAARADAPQPSTVPTPPAPTPPKPQTPVADKNSPEFKRFLHESEVIQDRSTSTRPAENRAYWRVLSWVDSQSIDDLKRQPFHEISFNDLVQYPKKYRGELVRVELSIRKVSTREVEDLAHRPRKLYELWGWPTNSSGWFYDILTPELPPGFPIGDNVDAAVTAYGYFFKLQGYQPANAKPNVWPLAAPLLVGRVSPMLTAAAPSPETGIAGIVLIVGCAIVVAVVVGWCVAAKRKPTMKIESSLALPDPSDLEELIHE
jgi:hypothetical protein